VARCSGVKRDGRPCERIVPASQSYCYSHDPANADKRRRAASKAGKSTGSREITDLKQRLSAVVDGVLDGTLDRGRAAVAVQGLSALRGVLELERRVQEQEQLLERLEILERLDAARRTG
jgi:antitoxin (DNA-binding transcriptional repressor) of toxin-antitoxin stability system